MSQTDPAPDRPRKWLAPAFAAIAFALLSLAILPYPGLQDDEVLFTGPLYVNDLARFSVKLFGANIPFMLTSYSGMLKTWLFAGLFEFFAPSRWSLRVPMVLIGVVTIWLTWMWTRRVAGTLAAAFTVALLSVDSIFILTNVLDWGPVALQHVLLMGGLLALQIWLENEKPGPPSPGNGTGARGPNRMLALAFFLWGLGLWDKALLAWPLGGLAVATLCFYPRELIGRLRPLPIAVAAVSLLAGAMPLVWYNLAKPGETASENMRFAADSLPGKVFQLRHTLDGSGLFGPIVATTHGPIVGAPKTAVERVSVALARFSGDRRENLMLPAIAVAVICMLLQLRTPRWRLPAFLMVTMAVAWLQMAVNAGTGTSPHHVILIWPFPCIFVGVALGGVADHAPRNVALALKALVAAIVCMSFLNTNEYLADLRVNGALGAWTDASYRLPGAMAPYRSRWIGIVDWGYLNGLRLSYEGDLKLFTAADSVRKPVMTEEDRRQILTEASSPDFIFVQHTEDKQIFPGVNDALRDAALALGYAEHPERTLHDKQGRPVFEIFRFVPAGPGKAAP